MLFFAAAILYSSVNVLGVTGPVAVPPHVDVASVSATQQSSESVRSHVDAASSVDVTAGADVATAADVTTPADVSTHSAAVEGLPISSFATLRSCGADSDGRAPASLPADLDAPACLSALAGASSLTLGEFGESLDVDSGADLTLAQELGAGADEATAVRAWWSTVPTAQRTVLLSAVPSIIGNLEGVPYSQRNLANRITLSRTIDDLEQNPGGTVVGAPTQGQRLAMLQQVQQSLIPGYDGNDTARSLVSLDTVYPGRAAVAIGDLDTAKNVSLMVPGMMYTVSTQMVSFTNAAAAVQSSETFWSNTLATTTSAPESSAVVSWMGYRTPVMTNVLGLSLAKAGAVHLENAVEGLDAVRLEDEPRTTIIGHSYGSTTATIALSSGTIRVDDFVALGSPGSVVADAGDLAVTAGHVFAGAAALDPVAGSGVFGADPGSVVFGSKLLNLGSAVDPYTSQKLTAVVTHNEYFTTGSHAMRSLALIGIGRGDLADGRDPVPDGPQLVNGPSLEYVRPQDVTRESVHSA